ncbi:MAG: UDP-N-acetylmuramate--L-alanine ligase [Devosia sp. 67-54]|uniref:UDP-N-acetylmuramate--L-alanine ligase n=1 Tax=unclassified Devosia TaxID=196773 RepID=UPI00095FF29C|nr:MULTISPECIES: UDP-N-acetylmuramate--L-alanine ligase [unclassified Devosia]MBN9303907.1 UDP-N-acetylmuramate--L-alanine ligase [Devosia sp.]OJX17756.1 MAG: UDP-N-acetylmuramate--L-alanine ligase [Devosia sp. 67-54]
MKMPRNIGPVHFVGIGGIGMSGIAEILHNQGYKVHGSDSAESANVQRLRTMGIDVKVGQSGDNLGDAAVVVISSAIKKGNPELAAARSRGLPVVRRAEMLAEIMRFKNAVAIAGTHGKTTTTTLVATLLDAANFDPTVINGGIINAYGTNARLGDGEWMVVEADESDGTFVKLPADVAVVTNIDPEHLDHYGDFESVKQGFLNFVENVPFYGFAVMCTDHPVVQEMVGLVRDRRVITYGRNPQADVRLVDLDIHDGQSHFAVEIRDRIRQTYLRIEGLTLPMPGEHNALNATAAIAVADQLKVPAEAIRKGLLGFSGVKRRFTRTGIVGGVTVIDDYGHHPVEIAAVLRAARQSTRRDVIAVVQPHRYSRVRDLYNEFATAFNDADTVVVAPIYAAGEAPIDGVTHEELVTRIKARGHRDARVVDRPEAIAPLLASRVAEGDYVVMLGAGNITQWAAALPAELGKLLGKEPELP